MKIDKNEYGTESSFQKEIANKAKLIPVSSINKKSAALAMNALALVGEAGELANKLKKILWYRKGKITEEDRIDLTEELGDIMWHIAQLATELDVKLETILRGCLKKTKEKSTLNKNKLVQR